MRKTSNEFNGVALAVSGVLILSPDTLLIRLVELDPWSILAWRGVFQFLGIIGLLLIFYRGATWERCRAIGATGVLVGFIMSLGSLSFITSITLTSVANTLIIVSTSPLLAAAVAFIFLKERVPLRTVFAIVATLLGVAIMVWEDRGDGALMGDLAALGTAFAAAVQVTLLRHRRKTNMVPSLIFTGLFSAIIGFSVAAPILPGGERLIYLLLMGFIVAPLAWSLTSLAPRYIPGPEVRLIFLIEVVLGPLWVWLALGEEPPKATLAGGALVLLTLAFHAYLSLKAQSAKTSELLAGE